MGIVDRTETTPVQYREGKAVFMGMDIMVDERVLIPRPETELLVDVTADLCRERSWEKPLVLDVGTGSGVIPLGLTKRMDGCMVIGAEISEQALEVARKNIERFNIGSRVKLVASDMFSALACGYEGAFDCIVSNPPYVSKRDYDRLDAWVRSEPKIALYAGTDGMDYLKKIIAQSGSFLKTGGFVAVEVGYDQAEKVKESFFSCGFKNITGFRDFNGYERVITGCKHG